MTLDSYIKTIKEIWDNIENYQKDEAKYQYALAAVNDVINLLNVGKIRSCDFLDGVWNVNVTVKQAILLKFKLAKNQLMKDGLINYWDKISPKFNAYFTQDDFTQVSSRILPNAYVRNGVFLGKNVIIMPSFVNIGAYIDDQTLIDSMTTIGSCAQIGKRCHISSGVTIAGVLEPIGESPVIIEDDCFVGSGCQISEGVIVKQGSVLASGVILTSSTKIYNRLTKQTSYGLIPAGCVVVPGVMPSNDPLEPGLMCAVIVKMVDEKTRNKTSINDLLRYL